MMRRLLRIAGAMLTFAFVLWCADITGKWTAQVPGRSGQMRDVTFTFQASGQSLTGTMSGRNGDVPISDGKVDGDDVSFKVTQEFGGNSVTQTFTGKVSGGQI